MVDVSLLTIGAKTAAGKLTLDPAIFEAPVKKHLLHAEVRRQLSLRRAGTHSTTNRSAVSGGGSKPWRQKGTGRARQGTIRAPQWAGGGVVFGPVPRSHEHKLPKKVRAAALRSALSETLAEGKLFVVDSLELNEYKTRRMVEILAELGLAGESVLIVVEDSLPFVEGSVKNLPGVSLLRAEGLNVYDVLRHSRVLFTREAVARVAARLGTGGAPA